MNRTRRALLSLTSLVTLAAPAAANELRVETEAVNRPPGAKQLQVVVTVRWRNSWRTTRNHDAVWLIVKLRGNPRAPWSHAKLWGIGPGGAQCDFSADRIGVFCSAAAAYRGDIRWRMALAVEPGNLREADIVAGTVEALVFGVEMVYVPAGPFTIGDLDPRSVDGFSFYRSDADGNHAGTLRITSEAAIPVGRQAGSLFYKASQYSGDGQGPVPAAFPKGTQAFYVMKYEILQGQYATFLNCISEYATSFRSPIGGREYHAQRGSIVLVNGRYTAGSPDRPANFMSWDDGTAFADWAGLRPWTELEFTKAARGPNEEPVPNDFPWGNASKDLLLRRNQPNDELLQIGGADESLLSDGRRDELGASYYWVMDLAGSVWEKVITIGHPRGRGFLGTHGDGEITEYGLATNPDWPLGDHEAGGYGYRGGGYYLRGSAEGPLNPHSRVEQRPYGGWGGGPRGVAYGFRAARTADR